MIIVCSMKHLSAFLGVYWLATAVPGQAPNLAAGMISARTVYHADGTRTESVKDPVTREMTEVTYNANNVVVLRKIYLLNERGQVSQGNLYDGAGNLQARSQVFFDEFGRVKEERLVNLQGEVFQRTLHEYRPDGKPKPPKVINYNVKAPTMKPATIDFTKIAPPPQSPVASSGQPAAAYPSGSAASPPTGTPAQPDDGQPKKSFWKRLFPGKEKK